MRLADDIRSIIRILNNASHGLWRQRRDSLLEDSKDLAGNGIPANRSEEDLFVQIGKECYLQQFQDRFLARYLCGKSISLVFRKLGIEGNQHSDEERCGFDEQCDCKEKDVEGKLYT